MKNKKKKGFTLIELLAIIVILAIIAVITIPIILNIIENSRKGAASDSALGYKDAIQKYYVGKLAQDSSYTIPNGTYTVNGSNGYLTYEDTTLEITVSGTIPSAGAVELEKNNVKNACLKFGDYAVPITNGTVGEATKGSCNGTIVGASENNDTPTMVTAAQTILNKGFLTEEELANTSDKAAITEPVKIDHPAITENTATGSTIPALTSYRYMGADPNNWIYFNCTSYNENLQNDTNCERWRIISIENGQLKITADNTITDGPWDEGYVNDWATSDLNNFLNGKYINGGVAINYTKNSKEIAIDNKAYLTSYYDTFQATSSGTTGKQHGLLSSETVGMIADSTWYLGGGDSSSITAAQAYAMERGNSKYTGDSVARTTYVNSKVAIISPSDYGFASSVCYSGYGVKDLSYYDNGNCTSSNWMYTEQYTWLLSPNSSNSNGAWEVTPDGNVGSSNSYGNGVRPSVYLKSNIGISGTGTSSDPYKIIK